jgi:hypothetical protein
MLKYVTINYKVHVLILHASVMQPLGFVKNGKEEKVLRLRKAF